MTKRTSRKPGEIKPRVTMYKGIRMRSRLEADFAAFLDRAGAEWEYEPVCFAGPTGQWLPDFRAKVPDGAWTYFKVKPESLPDDDIDPVLERMTIAWLTEPTVILQLVIWPFGKPRNSVSIMGFPPEGADDDDLIWWFTDEADEERMRPWPGMGQFRQFVEAAQRRAESGEEPS